MQFLDVAALLQVGAVVVHRRPPAHQLLGEQLPPQGVPEVEGARQDRVAVHPLHRPVQHLQLLLLRLVQLQHSGEKCMFY